MAQMSRYCKAYPAAELRQFPEWHEQVPPLVVRPEEPAAGETAYFYLHDNYVVTAGLYRDENIAFGRVTDEWRSFCSDVLAFVIPDAPQEPAS